MDLSRLDDTLLPRLDREVPMTAAELLHYGGGDATTLRRWLRDAQNRNLVWSSGFGGDEEWTVTETGRSRYRLPAG